MNKPTPDLDTCQLARAIRLIATLIKTDPRRPLRGKRKMDADDEARLRENNLRHDETRCELMQLLPNLVVQYEKVLLQATSPAFLPIMNYSMMQLRGALKLKPAQIAHLEPNTLPSVQELPSVDQTCVPVLPATPHVGGYDAPAPNNDAVSHKFEAPAAAKLPTPTPTPAQPPTMPLPFAAAPPSHRTYTKSQRGILAVLRDIAGMHFDDEFRDAEGFTEVNIRPMIIGPTGCGKSSIAEQIAQDFGAYYQRVTLGSWIVTGADTSYGIDTISQCMRACVENDRVILVLDEMDKMCLGKTNSRSDWSSAIANDVFELLDARLNWSSLCTRKSLEPLKLTPAILQRRFRERVFIICLGTWQTEHTDDRAGEDVAEAVKNRSDIPPELCRRLHHQWLSLEYPEIEEVGLLLKQQRIDKLAARVGVPVDLHALYGRILRSGMAAVDDLRADLAVALHCKGGRQHSNAA